VEVKERAKLVKTVILVKTGEISQNWSKQNLLKGQNWSKTTDTWLLKIIKQHNQTVRGNEL